VHDWRCRALPGGAELLVG